MDCTPWLPTYPRLPREVIFIKKAAAKARMHIQGRQEPSPGRGERSCVKGMKGARGRVAQP
jgi:hypothetical protein